LSKYLIAILVGNQTADKVTEAFVKNVILVYGIPNKIVTDHGANFMSNMFKRICKLFKIEKINTTAYHPESNGALEGTHKTLTN
jgi:transposase InsO family protein